MYPGMAKTARGRASRRSRTGSRPRQGREVARRPLPEAARHHQLGASRSRRGRPSRAARPPRRARPLPTRAAPATTMATPHDKRSPTSRRTASPTTRGAEVLGEGSPRQGSHPRLRALPRLPHVLQVLRQLPILFDLIDKKHDGTSRGSPRGDGPGDGRLLPVQALRGAVPLHPREKHEFHFDFPKLIHRYKAQRAKARGCPAGPPPRQPGRAAALARLSFGLANVMNRVTPHRVFMQRPSGSTRTSCCPTSPPPRSRSGRNGVAGPAEARRRRGRPLPDLLRAEQRAPDWPRHARVMDRNQVKVACAKGLQCCGMPAWETGDLESVRKQARTT